MKTQSEKFSKMMERAKAEAGVTADDMKVSLLSSIADSLAVIADNISPDPKVIKDRSDIQLANEICHIAAKYTDANKAMMEIAYKIEKVLKEPVSEFKVYAAALKNTERNT